MDAFDSLVLGLHEARVEAILRRLKLPNRAHAIAAYHQRRAAGRLRRTS
jgi:hypothetical protein